MPRDYQPHKNNPYHLPWTLYRYVLMMVRDYDRLTESVDDLILSSPDPESPRRGGGYGDPTARTAMRIERMQDQIRAIDNALKRIPEEYRKGVFDWTRYRTPYPPDAGEATYRRHKQRFLYFVAQNLFLVE